MPAGYDAEVAELFRDLRAASAMSENDLAGRLGTRVDVVQALEQGALYALPPWAETCRVVNAYGAMLNLDVRPLLRRIYAQLEAGIVELRPKAMPDVPVMTPPESVDFAFETDRPVSAPGSSPLDIQWDPTPPSSPPQNPRQAAAPSPAPQNPRQAAAPSAPFQNPWPAPAPSPAPQAPWPNAAPSPFPQSWPGAAPQTPPQTPWPNAAPSRPAAPQPPPDRRPPPPPPPRQAEAPQPQPQPQPQVQPQQPPPRQPAQPQPQPPRAEYTPAASQPVPEKAKSRKSALLKWGIVALIVSVMAFGLWMVLGHSPGPSGAKSGASADRVLDPDDPRSRKADRLPSPF